MIIDIQSPQGHEAERKYIFSILLQDYLGFEIRVKFGQEKAIIILLQNRKELHLDDCFFSQPTSNWLKTSSLPRQPTKAFDAGSSGLEVNLIEQTVPVIYGNPLLDNKFISVEKNKIFLGLDVFGSSFFMLSRYEEAIKKNIDSHKRFSLKHSLAYQENFLHRPIINEYLEILWACMKYLCPRVQRRKREFRFFPSHDVDAPTDSASKSIFAGAKHIFLGA